MARNDQIWKYVHQCLEDSVEWFPDVNSDLGRLLPHHVLALCGEVGELANMVKKIDRGSLNWEDQKVQDEFRMELADIATYLFNIAGVTGTDLSSAYEVKRAWNVRRFGSGAKRP